DRPAPYPDRGGGGEDGLLDVVQSVRGRKYLQPCTRAALFHADREQHGIRRSRLQERRLGTCRVLGRQIVQIGLQEPESRRGLLLPGGDQAQDVGPFLGVPRARTVPGPNRREAVWSGLAAGERR